MLTNGKHYVIMKPFTQIDWHQQPAESKSYRGGVINLSNWWAEGVLDVWN